MKKEITIEFKIDDLKASEIAKVLIDEFYNKKGRKPDPFLFHPICTRPHAVDVACYMYADFRIMSIEKLIRNPSDLN